MPPEDIYNQRFVFIQWAILQMQQYHAETHHLNSPLVILNKIENIARHLKIVDPSFGSKLMRLLDVMKTFSHDLLSPRESEQMKRITANFMSTGNLPDELIHRVESHPMHLVTDRSEGKSYSLVSPLTWRAIYSLDVNALDDNATALNRLYTLLKLLVNLEDNFERSTKCYSNHLFPMLDDGVITLSEALYLELHAALPGLTHFLKQGNVPLNGEMELVIHAALYCAETQRNDSLLDIPALLDAVRGSSHADGSVMPMSILVPLSHTGEAGESSPMGKHILSRLRGITWKKEGAL